MIVLHCFKFHSYNGKYIVTVLHCGTLWLHRGSLEHWPGSAFTSWGCLCLQLDAPDVLAVLSPSSSLWSPGVRASKRRTLTDWINSSRREESGSELVSLKEVAEDRILAIMDNASHPLHKTLQAYEQLKHQTHSTPLPRGTAQEILPFWCHQTL